MSNIAVQINSPVNLTIPEVLKGISQLDTAELEAFLQTVGGMIARRKSPHLPAKESELLQIINDGYALDLQPRYKMLSEKLQQEQITEIEHEELTALITQMEQKNVERLQAMLELAQIRGVSLEMLMQELKLPLRNYVD